MTVTSLHSRRSMNPFGITHEQEPAPEILPCTRVDPDLFYSDDTNGIARAKALCQDCPHRTDCLEQALESDDYNGIWGGLTPKERRGLKRRQQRIAS